MGDRGNIIIEKDGESPAPIYLYTHWSGSSVKRTLQKALARKQRWTDGSYLTRIIFCELIGNDTKGETGFAANLAAIRDGDRVLSSYKDRNGTKFWIITEADRSATTALLPEEY